MKRMLTLIAGLVIATTIATTVYAAPNVAITNVLPNYVFVTNTFSDAGTTGLTVSNSYLCIKVSDLTFLTDAQAGTNTTSDYRALVYALNKATYDHYYALASTNVPAFFEISETVQNDSSTNADIKVVHEVSTSIRLSTITIPSE